MEGRGGQERGMKWRAMDECFAELFRGTGMRAHAPGIASPRLCPGSQEYVNPASAIPDIPYDRCKRCTRIL